jgi:predicted enzyme related to lactoylglutathione lyase
VSIKNALASVAVNDLSAAVQWYERVLGKPPDSRPMPEVAEWKFERGGWLQVYQLPERAGSGSFTLAVSSIDHHISQLNKLGVDTSHRSSGDKVKTVMISDPDGNHIAFAEAIDQNMAQ